jgi:cytochrome c
MKSLISTLVLSTFVLTPHSAATASEAMAQKNSCFACHAVDKKVLGPAFKDVAKKYADNKDATNQISKVLREGSSGKWGSIPMPGQSNLSSDDANALANWVLSLK